MKLLYFITRSEWGGAQAHLFELIKYEHTLGNEVVVLVGDEGVFTEKVRQLNNVKLYVLKNMVHQINPIKDIQATIEVGKIYKEEQPDVIHLHSSKAGAIGRLAKNKGKAKVIFTAHGWAFTENVNERKRKIYRNVEKFLMKYTDRVICVSKYDYNLGVKMNVISPDNALVVYNGCEIPTEIRPFQAKDQLTILMVARFSHPKDQEMLVKAVKNMKNQAQVTVSLVGDGELLAGCKELVEELGMEESVNFLGYQEDVDRYLNEADIFCLTSNYEGLPISIIEAMRLCLPVVATNVGGIPELVSTENGFLVERKDYLKLAENLDKMIDDNLLESLGLKSYEKAKSLFSIEEMFERTHAEYVK